MSDDEQRDAPDPIGWIRRLEDSVGPEADPIRRLAQHAWGQGSVWPIAYEPQHYGNLEFRLPESWYNAHPFLPTGLLHGEHGCTPFGPELNGGKAVVLWLKQSARMRGVPNAHADELLEKRAAAMHGALKGKFGIEPLEMRVYYPPCKVSERIAGTDHDCCAALILATTTKHADTLSNEILTHILAERTKAEIALEQERFFSKSPPSRQIVLEILAGCNQPNHALPVEAHDIVRHALGKPTVGNADEQGRFLMAIPANNEREAQEVWVDRNALCLPPHTEAILTIPLRTTFTAVDKTKAWLAKENEAARTHDLETVKHFVMRVAEEIEKPLVSRFFVTTLGADMIVITAESPKQYETLVRASDTITRWSRLADSKEAQWREYLDDRNIEHSPPETKSR